MPRPGHFITAMSVALAIALSACGPETSTPGSAVTSTSEPSTSRIRATPTTTPSTTPAVDPYAGVALIDGVDWTEAIDGARLRVYPSPAGRDTDYPGAEERAWHEVVTAAPDANSTGMRDQFLCHWQWARLVTPNKPSWNLEPWRPEVGYSATVEATCNPGGPER